MSFAVGAYQHTFWACAVANCALLLRRLRAASAHGYRRRPGSIHWPETLAGAFLVNPASQPWPEQA